MAYTGLKPADTQTLAQGPADIRNELEGLVTGQVVDAGLLNGIAAGNAAGKIPISNGMLNINLNADKVDGMDASAFAAAGHTHNAATTEISGFMSTTDKSKLDGIATGAQVNQNTFSNVRVGSTTIQADSAADTLELLAGNNIALTPDATNDRVTIAVTGKVANAAIADTAAACTGNAATASTLATARTIGINGDAIGVGTAFNGGTNITIPVTLPNTGVTAGTYTSVTVDAKGRVFAGANPTSMGVNITGNANTATKLATVRTINGVSFDGSANITLTATASGGNADTVGGFLANQLMGGFDGGHSFGTNGYQIFSNGLILQ
ncbi:phage tail protein [Anaerospora sp.]|uniref:phage tail protein n=1 Tax=Anaerospora sp. TaxID=1960278 RepID=UPI00289BFB79|nr:phage tail protein [Anaerospora sp.]